MEPQKNSPVSVIIPAFNEAQSIAAVVAQVMQYGPTEVIVVDDGSNDATGHRAKRAGARVVRHAQNEGKAAAMQSGVAASRGDILFFVDADIYGLTPALMREAVSRVNSGECDMYIFGIGRGPWVPQLLLNVLPLLSGIRAMRAAVFSAVPAAYHHRYGIETALNYFAWKRGYRTRYRTIAGLTHVLKERKRGIVEGAVERMRMVRNIVTTYVLLYLIVELAHQLKALRQKVAARAITVPQGRGEAMQ